MSIILKAQGTRSAGADAYSAIVLSDNPHAYWRMGETSGTQMTDSSGNGYHGTYQSNYTLNQTTGIAGSTLGCVQKTATSGYLAFMPAGAFPSSGAVTMECWTKWSASTMGSYGIIWYGSPGGERVWFQHFPWVDGIVYFDAGQTGAVGYDRISWNPANVGLQTANWHHWVFIKNEFTGEQKIYVDGILRVGNSGLTANGMSTMTVGQGQMMADWYGHLSDVAIYNYELTQADIDEHYQAGRYGSALAGYGELWCKSGTSPYPMFTNDKGVAGGLIGRENTTWQPRIQDGDLSDFEGQTYNSSTSGRWELINNKILVGTCFIQLMSKGVLSGDVHINGLPQAPSGHGFGHVEKAINLTGFDSTLNRLTALPHGGTTYMKLYYIGGTSGSTALQCSQLTDTTQLCINFAYRWS